jgi:hypothetical protein
LPSRVSWSSSASATALQAGAVVLEQVAGPVVLLGDDAPDLAVDALGGGLRVVLVLADLAAQEHLLAAARRS